MEIISSEKLNASNILFDDLILGNI